MSALLLRAYVAVVHRMGDTRKGATAIGTGSFWPSSSPSP